MHFTTDPSSFFCRAETEVLHISITCLCIYLVVVYTCVVLSLYQYLSSDPLVVYQLPLSPLRSVHFKYLYLSEQSCILCIVQANSFLQSFVVSLHISRLSFFFFIIRSFLSVCICVSMRSLCIFSYE